MIVGEVIKLMCSDTIPVKAKKLIIVGGDSENIATIFINTDKRNLSNNLQALQLPMSKIICPFLSWDSFADCSDLRERSKTEINAILQKEPGRKEGNVPKELMDQILANLKRAKTIPSETKKRYGLIV